MDSNQPAAISLSLERRRRVNRLKRIILTTIVVIILALLVVCGFLLFGFFSAQNRIKELEKENQKLQEENQFLSAYVDEGATARIGAGEDQIQAAAQAEAEAAAQTEDTQTAQDGQTPAEQVTEADQENVKRVYLTFDDGPSENTGAVLDILKQYQVKATFFVIGKTDETSIQLYRRIVEEGHSLGIHSYTHRYSQVYSSLDAFKNDVLSLQALLKEATGKDIYIYRFPGGSSNTVSKIPIEDCIRFLKENGFTYYDWNATNGDASGKKLAVEQMVASVMGDFPKYHNLTVLMHDGPGKQQTVAALPALIEQLQANGVVFASLDENAVPVQHVKAESVQ